jgi:hypothetical protein
MKVNQLEKQMDNYNYPPGSDTPDAPWNQKDAEVSDDDRDEAYKYIAPIMEWEGYDRQEYYNSLDLLDSEESAIVSDLIYSCNKPNPVMAVSAELRKVIEKQAEAWQDEKAEDICQSNW